MGIVKYDKSKAGFTKEAMETAGPDMEWIDNSKIIASSEKDPSENDFSGNNTSNSSSNDAKDASTFEKIKEAIGNRSNTGLCRQNGKVIYNKKGVFQKKFTGFVKHTNNKKYYVKKD